MTRPTRTNPRRVRLAFLLAVGVPLQRAALETRSHRTIQDLEMRNYYPIDILLLDTIEFRLLTEYQQSLLAGLIEEVTNKIPLTILNITETNLNYAPKLLKDFFKHGLTIEIK